MPNEQTQIDYTKLDWNKFKIIQVKRDGEWIALIVPKKTIPIRISLPYKDD